jgi:ubiquinone/menaquinone biosynthesis C-methylase UbiE
MAAIQAKDILNIRRHLAVLKNWLKDLPTLIALRDPAQRWLFANRHLRMDANTDINDVRRRDFHKDRYELAVRILREKGRTGAVLLDGACGTGYGSDILKKAEPASIAGVDIAADAVSYAQKHYGSAICSFQVQDVSELTGFPDGRFDAVISFETIEHIDRPLRFLERAQAVLKPGGLLILSTPNKWGLTMDHKFDYDYATLLDHVGRFFSVEEVYAQNSGCLDLWVNRGQPRRIVKAQGPDRETAECFIAVCRKA